MSKNGKLKIVYRTTQDRSYANRNTGYKWEITINHVVISRPHYLYISYDSALKTATKIAKKLNITL